LQIAPAGAVAKFETYSSFIPAYLFVVSAEIRRRGITEAKERWKDSLVVVVIVVVIVVLVIVDDDVETSLVRERASDRCELRRRGLCKREWFPRSGEERDRENRVGVDDDGDGGRVLLLVITTFVASTARGVGRSLLRGSLAHRNSKTRPLSQFAYVNTFSFVFFSSFFFKWRSDDALKANYKRSLEASHRPDKIIRDRERAPGEANEKIRIL